MNIVVSFPNVDKLDIVADFLEETGFSEVAEKLREGRNPKFKIGDLIWFRSKKHEIMKITGIRKQYITQWEYFYDGFLIDSKEQIEIGEDKAHFVFWEDIKEAIGERFK